MNRFFGSFFGSLVGIALIGLLFFGIWQVQLPASAAPTATPTEEPTSDVICVTSSDGDDICLTPADWLVLLEKIQQVTGNAITADAPATPTAEAPAAPSDSTVVTSEWTPEQKCEWLRMNFPQTTAGVQSLGARLGNVDTKRIATHIYHCDASTSVFDGFIVLGPNEGFSGAVTYTVPQNGAIDAYSVTCGARYSATPTLINDLPENCDDTWRAVEGTVTAQRLTYWPFNDDNPPTSAVTVAPAAAATADITVSPVATPVATAAAPMPTDANTLTCVNPTALATQMKWNNKGWADQTYGGLRVELTKPGELPALWEAQSSGREVKQDTANREMVPGVWTIYPPYDCREELGFSR